jgi:hypothetical protein
MVKLEYGQWRYDGTPASADFPFVSHVQSQNLKVIPTVSCDQSSSLRDITLSTAGSSKQCEHASLRSVLGTSGITDTKASVLSAAVSDLSEAGSRETGEGGVH